MAITPIDQKGRAKAISDDIIPLEWKFRTNSRKTIIDRVIRRSGEGPHIPYGALGSPTRLFSLFWQSPCLFRSSDPTGAFLILPSFGGSSLSGLLTVVRTSSCGKKNDHRESECLATVYGGNVRGWAQLPNIRQREPANVGPHHWLGRGGSSFCPVPITDFLPANP
jgi:hypothetical protein